MSDVLFVYVTCPTEGIAFNIARDVVEARHAACANILPAMKSIYRWDNKIETADEVALILKTSEEAWPALREAVVKAHPYDVPCIVALPFTDGHEPYLRWVQNETILP